MSPLWPVRAYFRVRLRGISLAPPRPMPADSEPKRPAHGRSRGQSLVELALVLPVMLLLLVGALDLGRVFYAKITIANSAKEAVMVAASGSGSFVAGATCNKTSNSVMCAATMEGAGGFVTVLPANVTATVCPADASFGASASATVKAPFKVITPFITALLGGSDPMLSATATARCAVIPDVALSIPNSAGCTIPDLVGQNESTAASAWSAASFTGAVTPVGPGSGWLIAAQSPASGGTAACTSGVTIYKTASNCTVPTIGKNWYFAEYKTAWIAAGFTGALTDSTGGKKVDSVIPAVGTSTACTSVGTANK